MQLTEISPRQVHSCRGQCQVVSARPRFFRLSSIIREDEQTYWEMNKHMVKMTALYRRPPDVDAFMEHYETVHLSLVRSFPGLLKLEISRMFVWDEKPADPFLQVDMYFASREQLLAALKSPPGRASGRDAQEFAGEYIQIFFADVDVETFGGEVHGDSGLVRGE